MNKETQERMLRKAAEDNLVLAYRLGLITFGDYLERMRNLKG